MFYSTKQPRFFSIPMLYRAWIRIIRLQKNDMMTLIEESLLIIHMEMIPIDRCK